MDTKPREINNLCVEIMNSKRQVRGTLGHEVQISRLPFDVNVKLDLCNVQPVKRIAGLIRTKYEEKLKLNEDTKWPSDASQFTRNTVYAFYWHYFLSGFVEGKQE